MPNELIGIAGGNAASPGRRVRARATALPTSARHQLELVTSPVSLAAVYDKLNGLEPKVTEALVRHSADRLVEVIVAMKGGLPPLLPGYRTRILDGNHLAATQRRLKVLKRSKAGPLVDRVRELREPFHGEG